MGQNQNQIVKRKKKGRPSKADLANRAASKESDTPVTKNDVRRSLRRRNVRYTLDYDDFFIDEFDEQGEEEYDDDDEEEKEQRRREKKLKFLMQSREDDPESTPSRTQLVTHATTHVSPSSSDRTDGDNEEVRCKTETERKSYKEGDDSVPGTPERVPPLPDKKTLELILDKLQKKDIYGVYAEPVDPEELPDYHDVVELPMDFATVRKKLANGSYATLEQFESDVYLICTNAMQYNSADTVYHKQARTIQEMAERKFQRLRMAAERRRCCEKEEVKLLKKKKPVTTTVNSIRNLQETIVCSDFSSGATLATPPPPPPPVPVPYNGFDGNSSFIDGEDLSGGKAIFSKFGKKSSLQDENRRATYNQLFVKSDSIFATFESEIKHLVAVGPHADNSYSRSLARFSATLGPVAWKVASKRIEQALPPGSKFGPGWVGEYEPLPNPTILLVEKCVPQNETTTPKSKNHIAASTKQAAVTQSRADHHQQHPQQKKAKKMSIETEKQIQLESGFKQQMVKIEPEIAQNQKKPANHSPTVSSNAAQAAARVWMSVGASVNNTSTTQKKKNQITADSSSSSSSFHQQLQQPQVSRFRGEFPFPGMMMHNFQASMENNNNNNHSNNNIRPSMIFPQLVTADLSRFQPVQSPRRQKQESFAPDLNISFQSSGSPGRQSSSSQQQQPDLALQL